MCKIVMIVIHLYKSRLNCILEKFEIRNPKLKLKHFCRRMEDLEGVNGVKGVNGEADRIYYNLDGEGDADSLTTPHNVDHHRDRKFHFDI